MRRQLVSYPKSDTTRTLIALDGDQIFWQHEVRPGETEAIAKLPNHESTVLLFEGTEVSPDKRPVAGATVGKVIIGIVELEPAKPSETKQTEPKS